MANTSQTQSSLSVRAKSDPAWEHFSFTKTPDNKYIFRCEYCHNSYRGGGINRMKLHLANIKGQIVGCKNVPADVCKKFRDLIQEGNEKRKRIKEISSEAFGSTNVEEEEQMQAEEKSEDEVGNEETLEQCNQKKARVEEKNKEKENEKKKIATAHSAFAGKSAKHRAKIAIAKWFYDACIPFNAANSPYFKPALNAIAGIGVGFEGPTYTDLRVHLLEECKKELELLVDTFRSNWNSSGCTIMADGRTDQRQRTLINFLVYCPSGLLFVKSIDASDAVKDANTLFHMFSEVVEWVGPSNVVHMVTDNAANYVLAGSKLHDKYSHIFWSPCAAHCLNLILKDISSLPHVSSLAYRASLITKFVYNHGVMLAALRKSVGWKEIVRPAATRFATTFITLQSVSEHKSNLQGLVTSRFFQNHKLSVTEKGRVVASIVLDNNFWDECMIMVKVVTPIVKLLRIVDADEKPSMGYVYEGMLRVKSGIQETFMNKKKLYQPYIQIVDDRWDKHLKKSIHAASYIFNPACMYDGNYEESKEVAKECMQGLLELLDIENICPDYVKALNEFTLYREKQGTFGRNSALASTKTMQPHDWWKIFGYEAPLLQNIAIRILSQTASSSGCERNWSLFERIHTKRRNRLEHKRLNDLVYVNYNLRLKYRTYFNRKDYDPVDYECIDRTDFWIVEDESPEFRNEEIENILHQADSIFPVCPSSSSCGVGDFGDTSSSRGVVSHLFFQDEKSDDDV